MFLCIKMCPSHPGHCQCLIMEGSRRHVFGWVDGESSVPRELKSQPNYYQSDDLAIDVAPRNINPAV